MLKIVIIAHNLRSLHNIGSLLRTADGLGVTKVYLTGYTPHPRYQNDPRLPHISNRQTRQINKTALGAEKTQMWQYNESIEDVILELRSGGYTIVALEQDNKAVSLPSYSPPKKIALILGSEVQGLDPNIIKLSDEILEIPMFGKKESFNVIEAATMAMYHFRFDKYFTKE